MVGNIGCYSTPSCSNPVIGQCPGYNGNCGLFYCRTHSMGKLCGECSATKEQGQKSQAQRARIERILPDYIATAKKIKSTGPFLYLVVLLFGAGGIAQFIYSKDLSEALFAVSFWGGLTAIVVGIIITQDRAAERSIANAEKSRPGFRKFYESYKPEADADSNSQVLLELLGAIVGGVIEGTARGVGEAAKHIGKSPTERAIRDLEKSKK